MVKVNVLADCLRTIVNAEKAGRKQVLIRPVSKVVVKFLRVMQKHGYIGEFEIIDDHRSQKIVVELIGRINKCGVISPRFDIKNTVRLLKQGLREVDQQHPALQTVRLFDPDHHIW